jgi:hypothetical protein
MALATCSTSVLLIDFRDIRQRGLYPIIYIPTARLVQLESSAIPEGVWAEQAIRTAFNMVLEDFGLSLWRVWVYLAYCFHPGVHCMEASRPAASRGQSRARNCAGDCLPRSSHLHFRTRYGNVHISFPSLTCI